MKKTLLLAAMLCAGSFSAHADIMSLDGFSKYGTDSAGNWVVSADQLSVTQTINGAPTYFLNNTPGVNQEYSGQFRVDQGDDDFIGFVFGYTGLNDYYLFDWKAYNQTVSGALWEEGFRLMKIGAGAKDFGGGTGAGITMLSSNLGSGKGWRQGVTYNYLLGYTDDRITITLNGGAFNYQQVIDIGGLTNNEGQYGFYNYSQGGVTYYDSSTGACLKECGTSANLQGIDSGTYNVGDVSAPLTGLGAMALMLMGLARRKTS